MSKANHKEMRHSIDGPITIAYSLLSHEDLNLLNRFAKNRVSVLKRHPKLFQLYLQVICTQERLQNSL